MNKRDGCRSGIRVEGLGEPETGTQDDISQKRGK